MYSVLVILMVIVAVLMCFIVIIQESKGGGLASGFSSSNQIMGVRKTTDFIEKSTWTLAIALVVLSVASSYFVPSASEQKSVVLKEKTVMPTSLPMQQTKSLPSTGVQQGAADASSSSSSAQPTDNK
jgi:preprotein translocase subunit SecG